MSSFILVSNSKIIGEMQAGKKQAASSETNYSMVRSSTQLKEAMILIEKW
jgi:hypothetical protein